MAATCPSCQVELITFEESGGSIEGAYLSCPRCKRSWISFGILGLIPAPKVVQSNPPAGYKRVYNIYVDPATDKLIFRTEE